MHTPWAAVAATLTEAATAERDAALLEQVRAGNTQHRWATITATGGGHTVELDVSEDALRVGTLDDCVRITVNATTAQLIADHFGALLLAARMADLIRQQAAVVIAPANQTPNAAMGNTSRMVEHSRTVDQRVGGRAGLVANAGKDWVLTNRLAAQPDRSANYGWHVAASKYPATLPGLFVLQPLGLAHNRFHVDYSQTVRMVRSRCRVDGAERALVEVLADPTLAPLICHEGVLRVLRQPGVPPAPSGGVGEAVAGAGAAIAAGARELASALFSHGGGPVPPPSPSSQGGHPLPATPPPKKEATMSRSTIRRGSTGPLVSLWQAHLGLSVTGTFSIITDTATREWQKARGLVADGVVGPASWAKYDDQQAALVASAPSAPPTGFDLDSIKMVKARSYRVANRPPELVELIVLHSMEAAEKPSTAENVAAWFASAHNPGTSAHYCIDSDSIVQCVPLGDIAFAAPGSNHNGIQIELSGYAKQTAAEWDDEFSRAMLARAAELMGALSARYNIPLEYVDEAGLKAGRRGVTTHYDVSKAFKKSTHRDPGPGFPMQKVLADAMAARASLNS